MDNKTSPTYKMETQKIHNNMITTTCYIFEQFSCVMSWAIKKKPSVAS